MNGKHITVELSRLAQTKETGLVISVGTRGKVVALYTGGGDEGNRYSWLIDFGLAIVTALPYDSPLIQL
jgi:hypothetical protein